jgi:hypothetical protein
MVLTLDILFNDPNVVKATIDRVMQTRIDEVYWKKYLDYEETRTRTFKTYLGSVTGVVMGSVIDRNSGKPIRERRALGQGFGEVAYLGNRFQMDNDRLDMLKAIVDKYNVAKPADSGQALNEIINYIADDYRQVLLAPHKRMDYVVGQLRSTGSASVTAADNPDGVELIEINLPFKFLVPDSSVQARFISYMKDTIENLRATFGVFSVMEMTRPVLNKYILNSTEFKDNYKMLFGGSELAKAGGLMTDAMANQLLTGIGLPAIRVVEEYVVREDGKTVNTFADNRITLLPSDKIGRMMWHEPYEASDPIPNKTYTRSEGGMYISNVRTDEGRFMEYGCEWIPNFSAPQRIVNFDLSAFS